MTRGTTGRRNTIACAALVAVSAGCVGGRAIDATTGSPASNVTVSVYAQCTGTGCVAGLAHQRKTNAEGWYVFDAYGNYNGSSQTQLLWPVAGYESLLMVYGKAGYAGRGVVHFPQYSTSTDSAGVSRAYTIVPEVFLCPTGARDTDGDSVCDDAEARYGTRSNARDSDGDGFSDRAELFGLSDLDLRHYGANPMRKDVFLEIDYYADRKPTDRTVQLMVDAFAAAPNVNPDGSTGIQLHVLVDDAIASADVDPQIDRDGVDMETFMSTYFEPRRAQVFHYALAAASLQPDTDGTALLGTSFAIPNNFLATGLPTAAQIAAADPSVDYDRVVATVLMHELGHNLGLRHGGNENRNKKPNYLSVMNYSFSVSGIIRDGVPTLDYSRVTTAAVSEAQLNELAAFAPVSPTTESQLSRYSVHTCTKTGSANPVCGLLPGNASVNLDFNRNGSVQSANLALDLDGDGTATTTFSASQNDWLKLIYHGGNTLGDPPTTAQAARLATEPEAIGPCIAPLF